MVSVPALIARRVRAGRAAAVQVVDPPAGVVRDRDVEAVVRDGTILRVDVYRPVATGRYPVIMCAHPYGKDRLPRPRRRGGYRPVPLMRLFRHPDPIRVSAWTGWEAPDPAYWVPRGYVVVNADLRGFGRSDGIGDPLSDQEGRDYHDLIEWAGTQPWSTGKVGLDGVSYLAISQYAAAATRPPHLAAICPWEGFTDVYRDFARPGGVREDGFIRIWAAGIRRTGRVATDLRTEQIRRECFDEYYRARCPDLERIDVPALVCASFSDHNLHSRGSFEAFRRIGSRHKWLYTHRGGKWSTYYSAEAYAARERFFGWALKGEDTGQDRLPPVRLEIRDTGSTVAAVTHEPAFPPPDTTWRRLRLDAATGTLVGPPPTPSAVGFASSGGRAVFAWTVDAELDVVGPMWLRLHVELAGGGDAPLFAAVRKVRAGQEVTFEGSYGWEYDPLTHGAIAVSFREADPQLSKAAAMPVHTFSHKRPLAPAEIAAVDVGLLPCATRLRPGDILQVDVRGRWLFPRDPIRGQFPAWYERGPKTKIVLHTGGARDAALRLPVAPPRRPGR